MKKEVIDISTVEGLIQLLFTVKHIKKVDPQN
jgi:hypothetical protein